MKSSRRQQAGLTTVEFAIVSTVIMILLIGVLEIGRAFFVYASLEEVARRGARLAAVCPINDPAIRQVAAFNPRGDNTNSQIVPALMPADLQVEYLDANGAALANPADPAVFILIRYVRVTLVGFQPQTFIPFLAGIANFTMPTFSATIPRESLGIPRDGVIQPC